MKAVDDTFIKPQGLIVTRAVFKLRRAVEVAAAAASDQLPYARLVECRTHDGLETVVLDMDVQRPQVRDHDIHSTERVAVIFHPSDENYPEVLVLRRDFPLVPHRGIRSEEFPRSLCLYDQPWVDVRLTWTAPGFIEWVREWFGLTARGELHREDQPLEALMFSSGHRVLLPIKLDENTPGKIVPLALSLPGGKDGRVIKARPVEQAKWFEADVKFAAVYINTPPRTHGVIHRIPQTLKDLCELVRLQDFDLLAELRGFWRGLVGQCNLELPMLLVLGLPKTRVEGGAAEAMEMKAFLTNRSLRVIGEAIGVWGFMDGNVSLLLEPDCERDGADVALDVFDVSRTLTWDDMATMNGLSERNSTTVVAIGAGALGSQVAMNLARAGWGSWTVVDDDEILPHNFARHALFGGCDGRSKAEMLACAMNSLCDDDPIATALTSDLLSPGGRAEQLDAALDSAGFILDMSASVAVARSLAANDGAARCASAFLSPNGRDLVVLAEDAARRIRLDEVEMYYYKALASEDALAAHLDVAEGSVRYGASCRDVSSRIPQDWIATHSGIAAGVIRGLAETSEPLAAVWRIDPETKGVTRTRIDVDSFLQQEHGEWQVLVAPDVVATVSRLRSERLPNETGGILVGAVDHDRKRLFIVEAIASPPDSHERPRMYVRGTKGLQDIRERFRTRTAGHLDYIGEWHSHPIGAATLPSHDDLMVFRWIDEHLFVEGKPPVMLICGDGNESRLFVGRADGPHPRPIWPD